MYSPAVASWLRPASGAPTFTGVLKRYPPGRLGAAPASGSLSLVSGCCWRLVVCGSPPHHLAAGGALGRVADLARGRPLFPLCAGISGSRGHSALVLPCCTAGLVGATPPAGLPGGCPVCGRAPSRGLAVGGALALPAASDWAGSFRRGALGGVWRLAGVALPPELAVVGLTLCRWTRSAPSGGARRSRVRSSPRWGGLLLCGSRGDGPPV